MCLPSMQVALQNARHSACGGRSKRLRRALLLAPSPRWWAVQDSACSSLIVTVCTGELWLRPHVVRTVLRTGALSCTINSSGSLPFALRLQGDLRGSGAGHI